MPNEIKEGGGVDAGVLTTNCGSRYYKKLDDSGFWPGQ